VIAPYREGGVYHDFCADAAFAKPEVYELLEREGIRYGAGSPIRYLQRRLDAATAPATRFEAPCVTSLGPPWLVARLQLQHDASGRSAIWGMSDEPFGVMLRESQVQGGHVCARDEFT
jgi:hypothetical protein